MVKALRISFFISLFLLSIKIANASPQAPDYLIIGNDTSAIFFLPMHQLDSLKQNEFTNNLTSGGTVLGQSFNLWRGYQAYWQLLNSKLYLVGIKNHPNSAEILRKTFPVQYQDGKVFAYWFSSYLAIGKDKMLKWDGIFSRTYFKEEIFNFKRGNLINRKTVENYIPVKNGISRLDSNRNHLTDSLFKLISKLNWKKLSDCGCDDKYLISISENKIKKVELLPYTNNKDTAQTEIKDHEMCIKKISRKFKNIRFDIVRWHGKTFDERYYLNLFYTTEGKLENWTE